MPIITSEMLRIDPVTYVVSTEPAPRVAPSAASPLGPVLAAFAFAGLATKGIELLAGSRR